MYGVYMCIMNTSAKTLSPRPTKAEKNEFVDSVISLIHESNLHYDETGRKRFVVLYYYCLSSCVCDAFGRVFFLGGVGVVERFKYASNVLFVNEQIFIISV